MIDGLRLEIKDVEPIVSADLDINKINIIGGKNSTGKSTASKLLYCFLKANSSDNDILLTFTLKKELDDIYEEFNSRYFKDPSVSELAHKIKRKDSSIHEKNHNGIMDPNDFEEDMIKYNDLGDPNDYRNPLDHVDYGDNMFNYLEDNSSYDYGMFDDNDSWDSNDYGSDMMEGYYESDEYVSDMMEEAYYSDLADEYYEDETVGNRIENPYDSEIIHNIRRLWNMLTYHDYDDFKEVINFFKGIEAPITDILETEALHDSKRPVPLFSPSDTRSFEILLSKWNKIKRILQSYEDYSSDFFKEVMKDLISLEFNMDFTNDPVFNKWLGHRHNYRINHAKLFDSLNSNFSFEVNLNDIGKEFESEGEFLVNNVFYLESYSILDSYAFLKEEYLHIEELKKYLKTERLSPLKELSSYKFNGELEKSINKIIGGIIIKTNDGSLRFRGPDNYSAMKNTASGVKQIAVIQTLLHNGFLVDNSVLIVDEPEVNLHPEWQIKLAQILVLLAKEGNIIIYINSHSPMFIEAMDTFSEYYDFEEYVNYYITEKSEDNKNGFEFKKVPSDELYLIYDNLGDPYDYLDRVRLSKGRGESIDDIDF